MLWPKVAFILKEGLHNTKALYLVLLQGRYPYCYSAVSPLSARTLCLMLSTESSRSFLK